MKFYEDHSECKEVLLYMVSELAEMWDGQLGTVRKVKHCINIDPADSREVRSSPYHRGPKESQLEKEKIDKLVSINVEEPEKS